MPRFVAWMLFAAALTAAQQAPTFRSGTHTVSLYTTVVDKAGHLKTDLTKDDFEVYDNGVKQDLSVFANDLQPITIVVMLDRSGSMMPSFDLEERAAAEFIRHLLPGDKARLGSFSHRVQIDPVAFTSNQDQLLEILRTSLQHSGPTPLWNATNASMTALAGEPGRRVVLVFTDGKDSPERFETNVSFGAVRSRAETEEIMIYAIGMANQCVSAAPASPSHDADARYQGRVPSPGSSGRAPKRPTGLGIPRPPIDIGRFGPRVGVPAPIPVGPPGGRVGYPGGARLPPPPDSDPFGTSVLKDYGCSASHPDPDLRELALTGGGGYFELNGPTDLAATFTRVADELHHQYLLACTATNLDGKVHKLEVRLKNPELAARARRSYLAAAR
jgi:VWFA-related protein